MELSNRTVSLARTRLRIGTDSVTDALAIASAVAPDSAELKEVTKQTLALLAHAEKLIENINPSSPSGL